MSLYVSTIDHMAMATEPTSVDTGKLSETKQVLHRISAKQLSAQEFFGLNEYE